MSIRPMLAVLAASFTLLSALPATAEVTIRSESASSADSATELDAFRQAVRLGSAHAVQQYLDRGLSPNFRMENGDTAFTYAVRGDTPEIAKALLATGKLDVNEMNKFGETPLMLAVFKGNEELFDALLKAGADPNAGRSWTPLHYAATEGRTKFIERLLAAGVSPNVQTTAGVTPLIMAARKPSRAAVVMLLKAGAYRDYCTDQGRSPADFARKAGDKDLAEYLAIPACAVKGRVAK
ncbi:ankyrin repeat domain-containing protein [Sutterella sp.]|uniref:ankyrin repeat domain-containing protein n=1 Tax=Sutterella sp. TaxID=1981025 RepID=UPI0026DF6C95|nr:ankyrin repeat domain-containing protein [Sutterella sp.]MDO5530887.1 ankyrin repeat domain-containing protein [Sutterella sp.]